MALVGSLPSSLPAYLSGVLEKTNSLIETVIDCARERTDGGRNIDDHQVLTRKIAGLYTKVEAATRLFEYAQQTVTRNDPSAPYTSLVTPLFVCRIAQEVFNEISQSLEDFGVQPEILHRGLGAAETLADIRAELAEAKFRAFGRYVLHNNLDNDRWILTTSGADDDERDLRDATRRFARTVIAPRAEEIHRNDMLIPEEFIEQMAAMGYFGMSVPEEYGGVGLSNLMMVIATEELSAASLSAAGSLITRPEILTRALLKGGTDEQKKKWIEPIATGKLMVAVAVTEPDIGSDVAHLSCKATPATVQGAQGYVLNGSKAWCTFAGRANVLALLARTDPDENKGHKGLSLFIVEKDTFDGYDFEMVQSGGGVLTAKADSTLGYRGMHSFTMQLQDFFVPAENLIGGEDGLGKGFYLQMDGFAVGRLQTGGRALGLAQASLEAGARYALERPQFGKPIGEFQSTEYEIGMMAADVEAARQLTYSAAHAMDKGGQSASLMAAMAKLFSCRVAVNTSQKSQLLHGGWGYAEEYAISRYVVDALVLPIFEGVEPILEMKVIGRGLLSAARD